MEQFKWLTELRETFNYKKKMVLFKGKKYGMVHTRDIELDDIRAVFFPNSFYEKYLYLGAVPMEDGSNYFKAIRPLVLAMDAMAKPWWTPRWFLRLLHLFGSDNSVVRVRNMRLHHLQRRLTKGIFFVDHKTKWEWYDLRLSIYGPEELMDLADYIEGMFYRKGKRQDLLEKLEAWGISKTLYSKHDPLERLEALLESPF